MLRAAVHRAGGGNTTAYFADTPGDLQNGAQRHPRANRANATTRTTPSYSPATSTRRRHRHARRRRRLRSFLAVVQPERSAPPWTGDIQRQRYLCSSPVRPYTVHAVDRPASGRRLRRRPQLAHGPRAHVHRASSRRRRSPTAVDSTATIRPYVVGDNRRRARPVLARRPTPAPATTSSAGQASRPPALGMTASSGFCQYTSTTTASARGTSTPDAQCADACCSTTPSGSVVRRRAVRLHLRLPRTTAPSATSSTRIPVVVGPPGTLLQDPTLRHLPADLGPTTSSPGRSRARQSRKQIALRRDQRRPAARLLGRREQAREQRDVGDDAAGGHAAACVDVPVEPRSSSSTARPS